MKKLLLLLWIILSLAGCSNSQPTTNNKLFTGDIRADLKSLITAGDHTADIMDGVMQTPRQVSLTKKFQDAVQKNYDWFLDYMKTVPDGEPIPWHEKLGVTKTEYEELMGYMNNIEVISTGKEVITCTIKDDIISFKSHGKLSDFDSLKIDLKTNTVILGQYRLPFSDSSNITNDKNGLRSKWKGYTWKMEEPKGLQLEDLNDLEHLDYKQYTFTIGRLEKNGKTYMSLKGREIESGEKLVDFELPVIF